MGAKLSADVAPLAQLLIYGNHDINQFFFGDDILNNLLDYLNKEKLPGQRKKLK